VDEPYPGLSCKDGALVSRGLWPYFIADLMSGGRFVSMPALIADDLWHMWILDAREYERFCRCAFGAFMHHAPATVFGENRKSNALHCVWWCCCKVREH